jgi:hypothetical protein
MIPAGPPPAIQHVPFDVDIWITFRLLILGVAVGRDPRLDAERTAEEYGGVTWT